jgi:hypothetical protein
MRALGMRVACVASAWLVACAPPAPCREDELVAVAAPWLAVVLSDYASTEIAIVERDGRARAPWLDSGSRPPELVAALSGDVVLPRTMPTSDALVLVDRYQTDVLTHVPFAAPREGLWQADLRGVRTAGTSPNPQDVLALPDGRWLVSRHNPAEDVTAPELARGNDLALVDPDARALVARFELGADVTVEGTTYFARPSGLARLETRRGPRVLVGLARLSALALRRTGPGAIALFDPASGATEVLELPGLSNCLAVVASPDVPGEAVALCRGDAFGEDETRAGLAFVDASSGALTLLGVRRSAEEPGLPPPGNGLVALGAGRVAYVSSGSFFEERIDRLVMVARTGDARVLGESGPIPFELGDGALDPARGELLVPDGNARAIRRFVLEGDDVIEAAPMLLDACLRLPPRQLVVLGR